MSMEESDYISRRTSSMDDKTNSDTLVQKAKTRKVQFSRPLEYWREFDKETGELREIKDSRVKEVELSQHCKNVETLHNTDRGNSGQNIAKTQSITEVIQAFQKRHDRRINALKQVEEKSPKDCTERKQRLKLASSSSYNKQLHKRSLLCNVSNCSKLDTGEKFLWNLRKESPHVQSYFTYSFSTSLCMLTSFTAPPPLPLVCTKSKVYDERLLPSTFESARGYPSSKTRENGLPPVIGKLTTPYIVQLFD